MLRTALLLPLLAAGLAAGEDDLDLARLLPPETPVYVSAEGPTPAEMAVQAVWKCWEEPALKRVLDRVATEDSSFSSMTWPLGGGASLRIHSDMRAQPVALSVRYTDANGERRFHVRNRVAVAWVGMQQARIPVDAVVAFEVDPDPKEALETVRRIAAAALLLLDEGGEGSVDEAVARLFTGASHRDVSYARAQFMDMAAFAAPIGRWLVVATSEARIRDMIDRSLDGARPSLATDPRHREILEHAIGEGSVAMRMDVHVDRALDALEASFAEPMLQVRGQMQKVGLGGLRTFSTVSRVDGRGVSTTTSVLLDGERRGLARLLEGRGKGTFGALAFAPRETLYVTCGSFDAKGLYETALEVGGMFVALGAARFEQQFGLKLKDDLLDQIGPEAALIVAPNRGLLPDLGLVLESPDAARLEASLLRMLRKVPWPEDAALETVKLGDVALHVIPLGHPEVAGVPMAPCFGVVDGCLLVAPYPISFQRFLATKRGERPSLAQNRDFASLRGRVPENAIAISYLDLARVVALFYDTLMPLLQAMPETMPGQRAPLYEIPDMSVLERHLYGRIGWTVADERGRHWYSHGSMDMTGLVAGAAGAATGIAAMLVGVHRPEPLRVKADEPGVDPEALRCHGNVRFLRARIGLYEKQHEARPGALSDLPGVPPERLLVPGTDECYVYFGPEGKGSVLLHGCPNGRDGKICVLTTGLETRRVTAEELERMLSSGSAPGSR